MEKKCTTCRKCLLCGFEVEGPSNIRHHLRNVHGTTISEYRKKFKIEKVVHNKKYNNPIIEVSCHICGNKFFVETKWYYYRLRKGKNRFACVSINPHIPSECKKKLQSITIKEIRSKPESRHKTIDQMVKHWSSPDNRAAYGLKMKAKSPEWHRYRLSATLKTVMSGKMTKPEKTILGYIKENDLPFKYIGDGSIWVGQLHPDFISTDGSQRIIEVFGCYWHGCQKCFPGSKSRGIPLNQRLSTFKKHGFVTKIIWEHEIKDKSALSELVKF